MADGADGDPWCSVIGGLVVTVLAQDPKPAAFQGVPRSAIGTGVVDLVLPPERVMLMADMAESDA